MAAVGCAGYVFHWALSNNEVEKLTQVYDVDGIACKGDYPNLYYLTETNWVCVKSCPESNLQTVYYRNNGANKSDTSDDTEANSSLTLAS